MNDRGFTLIEMTLMMAVIAIVVALFSFNSFGATQRANFAQAVDTLESDVRGQQAKAMTGATSGGVVPAGYGVHFDTTQYVLFSGAAYNALSPSNTKITFPTAVTASGIGFPGGNVIFASMSGEMIGYTAGQDSVMLINGQNNQAKTMRLNRYGTIVSLQ